MHSLPRSLARFPFRAGFRMLVSNGRRRIKGRFEAPATRWKMWRNKIQHCASKCTAEKVIPPTVEWTVVNETTFSIKPHWLFRSNDTVCVCARTNAAFIADIEVMEVTAGNDYDNQNKWQLCRSGFVNYPERNFSVDCLLKSAGIMQYTLLLEQCQRRRRRQRRWWHTVCAHLTDGKITSNPNWNSS